MARTFGEIEGVSPGSQFPDRAALHDAGVHPPIQAGISGSGSEGADSIVLNEGYEDDVDRGDEIIYTGQGGRDSNSGRQIADKELTRGNLALAVSQREGLPVRVIRGPKLQSQFAPDGGYCYDGLYRVEDHWQERGRSGLLVWRYRLRRLDAMPPIVTPQPIAAPVGTPEPGRHLVTVQRIIRNTRIAQYVKTLHDYRCQICCTRLQTSSGPYAEGAHIRPLGRPHDGPDVAENVLCLCPNCHVLFDDGVISVDDDLGLLGRKGALVVHPNLRPAADHLKYHRLHYGLSDEAWSDQ